MSYIRNFSLTILIGFFLFIACNNEEQTTKDTVNSDSPASDSSQISLSSQNLLDASLDGKMGVIKKAVEQDIDIDKQDQTGRTPLMLSAYNGHADVVQYLLKHGANPATSDNQGRMPLIFAASGPYPETVELLLKNGADPDKTDQRESWSALMWASAEGNEQVVSALLKYEADPHLQDNDGETARDFALNNGHKKVAELLKQAENSN